MRLRVEEGGLTLVLSMIAFFLASRPSRWTGMLPCG